MPLGTILGYPISQAQGVQKSHGSRRKEAENYGSSYVFFNHDWLEICHSEHPDQDSMGEHVVPRVADIEPRMEEAPQAVTHVSFSYSEMDFLKERNLF